MEYSFNSKFRIPKAEFGMAHRKVRVWGMARIQALKCQFIAPSAPGLLAIIKEIVEAFLAITCFAIPLRVLCHHYPVIFIFKNSLHTAK